MVAVNYTDSRNPTAALGGASKVASRRSIFSRFVKALKDSRRREARRVITTYAHLVADWDSLEKSINATCGRTRLAARSTAARMRGGPRNQ
jgi:hypothetical protein